MGKVNRNEKTIHSHFFHTSMCHPSVQFKDRTYQQRLTSRYHLEAYQFWLKWAFCYLRFSAPLRRINKSIRNVNRYWPLSAEVSTAVSVLFKSISFTIVLIESIRGKQQQSNVHVSRSNQRWFADLQVYFTAYLTVEYSKVMAMTYRSVARADILPQHFRQICKFPALNNVWLGKYSAVRAFWPLLQYDETCFVGWVTNVTYHFK